MIYRRYHAARAEKVAAEQASLDSDLAEIRGEVVVQAVAQATTAPTQPQQNQSQSHQQRNDQKRR